MRYVLEEDTKDDSWSSSFGPEDSSGPASQLFNQPVGPTAAETGALEVSQQLLGNCSAMCKRPHASMSKDFSAVHSKSSEVDD